MPGPVLVWKFGGSSIADHTRLPAVAGRMIAARRDGHGVVAVLSAMGKTTDDLAALAYELTDRPPLREMDALLSVGECISCALASMVVNALGAPAVSLNGAQAGIFTDARHSNARVQKVVPYQVTEALESGSIVLVTGFQGVSPDGDITTLGRGGADASAVALAAALGLRECEIFTDVAGVFTADPNLVTEARLLRSLRHEEMLEMAEGGAGVMQARAVELAAANAVDVHLRSSFTDDPGTWIRNESPAVEGIEISGVVHREQEWLYTTSGITPAALSASLRARGASVGIMMPGRNVLRFTVPGSEPAEVSAALAAVGKDARVHEEIGTVSVVSNREGREPEVVARALRALCDRGIEPRFVTTTTGRLILYLPTSKVTDTVRILHSVLITEGDRASVTDVALPARFDERRSGDAA